MCEKKKTDERADRILGCLLGGAAGDALGHSVEFVSYETILAEYGPCGVMAPDLINGKARITDDTQMTLFTAAGIFLWEETRQSSPEAKLENALYKAYRDWLFTQHRSDVPERTHRANTEFYGISELHAVRAPGFTYLRALRSGRIGRIDNPINDSKGNGGVMRVAPIGLYFDRDRQPTEETTLMGARSAAVTHGHPLGFIAPATMTYVINEIVYGQSDSLSKIWTDAMRITSELFGRYEVTMELLALLEKAIQLAQENVCDVEAIAQLGRSALAESALAIAAYCSLKHSSSFSDAVRAAVNFDGDSDTTGSITGNIMGAWLGAKAIPEQFIERLECRELIERTAKQLASGISC